jgi:hypothetical protein
MRQAGPALRHLGGRNTRSRILRNYPGGLPNLQASRTLRRHRQGGSRVRTFLGEATGPGQEGLESLRRVVVSIPADQDHSQDGRRFLEKRQPPGLGKKQYPSLRGIRDVLLVKPDRALVSTNSDARNRVGRLKAGTEQNSLRRPPTLCSASKSGMFLPWLFLARP